MQAKKTALWVVMGSTALLAGCASTPATKDVLAAPEAHLAKFAPAALKPEIQAKLPKGADAQFRKIEVDVQVAETNNDERPARDAVTATYRFVNAGGGLVQSYDEFRNNGVPFRLNYRLSYRGLLALKAQTVFHGRPNADMAFEVKVIKRMDPVTPLNPGATFQFESTDNHEVGTMPAVEIKRVCTVGAAAPASQLHPALQGQSHEIACDNHGTNGSVVSKSTFAYLTQYGFAIPVTFANSSSRSSLKVTAVRIQ